MKAILIGATGLVGGHLLGLLLKDPSVTQVLVLTRRTTGKSSPKLREEIIDFNRPDLWRNLVKGDVLFSALGTTLKAAGSKEAQYLVDHDYQLEVAKAASVNGVKSYVLISSVNADAGSSFFYLKMKGELEEKIKTLSFESVSILRPGPLSGHREKERTSEVLSLSVLKRIPKFLLPPSMTPVEGGVVALIALDLGLKSLKGIHIVGPLDLTNFKTV